MSNTVPINHFNNLPSKKVKNDKNGEKPPFYSKIIDTGFINPHKILNGKESFLNLKNDFDQKGPSRLSNKNIFFSACLYSRAKEFSGNKDNK